MNQVYRRGLEFLKTDHGNKVTEDDYVIAIIKQMEIQRGRRNWEALATQLQAARQGGRTFADMMEHLCAFMRIQDSAEKIFEMLITTAMQPGSSAEQHLAESEANFLTLGMSHKEKEALNAAIQAMEAQALPYMLKLQDKVRKGKVNNFVEAIWKHEEW